MPGVAQQSGQNVFDARLSMLQSFFQYAHSPLKALAGEFLEAADRHGLDWRLLPSISMVETGCGRTAVGNNLFGWNSGLKRFASAREAIRVVAARLAESKLYRGKDLNALLATYNSHPRYAARVRSVMGQIGPSEAGAARLVSEASLSRSSSPDTLSRSEPLQ